MKLNQRILFAILGLLIAMGVRAQEAEYINVDLNLIKVNVSMNPEHYRELKERYLAADTTLRVDEIATVYYGYAATMDYAPELTFPDVDAALEAKDYASAYELCMQYVKENPVSLSLLYKLFQIMPQVDMKGNLDAYINIRTRLEMLIGTVLASGTGISSSSPIKVISESDMMVILNDIFEVDKIVDRTKIGDVDAVKITFTTSTREHILYFDNSFQANYK